MYRHRYYLMLIVPKLGFTNKRKVDELDQDTHDAYNAEKRKKKSKSCEFLIFFVCVLAGSETF
jgi:hypothetical protein